MKDTLSHTGLRKHISHNNAALLATGIRRKHDTLDCSQCDVSMLHGSVVKDSSYIPPDTVNEGRGTLESYGRLYGLKSSGVTLSNGVKLGPFPHYVCLGQDSIVAWVVDFQAKGSGFKTQCFLPIRARCSNPPYLLLHGLHLNSLQVALDQSIC